MTAGSDAVREALTASAEVGPFFRLSVGASGEGWRPAAGVYASGLRAEIDATGERLGVTERRVAAATVHLGFAARLWSPVLGCALLYGLVPNLTRLRLVTSPSLRLNVPGARGWRVTAAAGGPVATGELAALVYRVVVGQHLEPLASGLAVKIAPGLLRGNAAAAMTGALRVLVAAHPEVATQARDVARELLATGMLRGTGELTGPGLEFRRRSCCLFYRVPGGGLCGDCPLPGPPARAGSPRANG